MEGISLQSSPFFFDAFLRTKSIWLLRPPLTERTMTNTSIGSKLAYSIPEAAAAISIGRSKIYSLIAEGQLETRKIGKRTVIPAGSLIRLIEGGA